jgi:hypothetical protein
MDSNTYPDLPSAEEYSKLLEKIKELGIAQGIEAATIYWTNYQISYSDTLNKFRDVENTVREELMAKTNKSIHKQCNSLIESFEICKIENEKREELNRIRKSQDDFLESIKSLTEKNE